MFTIPQLFQSHKPQNTFTKIYREMDLSAIDQGSR